jgi:hypothetical protein
MKKSAKLLCKSFSEPIWETPNRPSNTKCIVPAFFEDRFEGKGGGLRSYKPDSQELEDKVDFVLRGLGL